MMNDYKIDKKQDVMDGMMRYVSQPVAENFCRAVTEQEQYIGKTNKNVMGIIQNEGVIYFVPGSTWTDFMQGILTQGKYQDVILTRAGRSFDYMNNGEGVLSEKVYFTDSRKSCIVVQEQCAVAYQYTNGHWNLYSSEKGIDFPWIQALARKYRLGRLSNRPRVLWFSKEGYRYRDNMKKLSLYAKAPGCEWNQFDHFESPFLQIQEVERPSNHEVILDIWWHLGDAARAERVSMEVSHMSKAGKYDRNPKFPFRIVFNKVADIEKLPIQLEITHNTLGEENPYTTGTFEFDGQPKYKGEYLWITRSEKPWLKMDGMFVPVDRDAIQFICDKNPEHPAIHEYLIWKRMEELK